MWYWCSTEELAVCVVAVCVQGSFVCQETSPECLSRFSLESVPFFHAGKDFETEVAPYSVYGSAVTEVLIDVMTGETLIERMDIIMDLGTQLDAAVDIGQVQGGVVISLGYLFTEDWHGVCGRPTAMNTFV